MQDEVNQNQESAYLTESLMRQFSSGDMMQLTLMDSEFAVALQPPVKGVRNERLEGVDNHVIAGIEHSLREHLVFAREYYEAPDRLKPEFIERMQEVRNIINTAIGLHDNSDPEDWHAADAAKTSDVPVNQFKQALQDAYRAMSHYPATRPHKKAIARVLDTLEQLQPDAEERPAIGKHTEAVQLSGSWERG